MKKIGVVLPYNNRVRLFDKIFGHSVAQVTYIKEYDIEFICVYEFRNFQRIFKKMGIKKLVLLTAIPDDISDFKVLNGDFAFKKMLGSYVRKTLKGMGEGCTVTVVDKIFSEYTEKLLEELCVVCRNVNAATENKERATYFADKILDKYGAVINVYDKGEKITTDVVVILEECGNTYDKNSLIISKNYNGEHKKVVSDFRIPFLVKPHFGMSNLVFSECIDDGINNG